MTTLIRSGESQAKKEHPYFPLGNPRNNLDLTKGVRDHSYISYVCGCCSENHPATTELLKKKLSTKPVHNIARCILWKQSIKYLFRQVNITYIFFSDSLSKALPSMHVHDGRSRFDLLPQQYDLRSAVPSSYRWTNTEPITS